MEIYARKLKGAFEKKEGRREKKKRQRGVNLSTWTLRNTASDDTLLIYYTLKNLKN